MIQLIIGIFFFIFISGFLEMVEMAIVFSDKVELEKRKESGSRRAGLVLSFVARPEWLFTLTLIGSDIAIVMASFYFEHIVSSILPVDIAIPTATIIMSVIVVIFSQILPKGFGMRYSISVAMNASYFVKVFSYIILPLIFVEEKLSNLIVKVIMRREPKNIYIKKEEMRVLLNMRTFRGLEDRMRLIINNILDLSEFDLKSIMKGLDNLDTIEMNKTVIDVFGLLKDKPRDRFIVFDEGGRAIGVLYTRDILVVSDLNTSVSSLVRVPVIIGENTTVENALRVIKSSEFDCAFICNSQGNIIGYIDIDDIYEIIFGSIPDEVESKILY